MAALDSEAPQVGPREIVPGVRRDRLVDIAVGAARREGEAVPDGGPALLDWLRRPLAPGVTRYLLAGLRRRPDLRPAFPDPTGADADALAPWAWTSGVRRGPARAGAARAGRSGRRPVAVPAGGARRVAATCGGRTPIRTRTSSCAGAGTRACARASTRSGSGRRPTAPRGARCCAPGCAAAPPSARAGCRSSRRCSRPAAGCSPPSGVCRRAARPRPAADARGAERGEGGARRATGPSPRRAGSSTCARPSTPSNPLMDGWWALATATASSRSRSTPPTSRCCASPPSRPPRPALQQAIDAALRACARLSVHVWTRVPRGRGGPPATTSAPSRRSSPGPHGKPRLAGGELFFNLSHSGGHRVLAVAAREVGDRRRGRPRPRATSASWRRSASRPPRPARSKRPRRTSGTRSSTACGSATRRA